MTEAISTAGDEKKENLFPKWDPANADLSMQAIYEWTMKKARVNADWYIEKTGALKFFSRFIRAFSILLSALGTLCPLIDSLKLEDLKDISLGQYGYIFFAVAAGLFLFDKFFGISTNWMRFIATHAALDKKIDEFQYDWLITINQLPDSASPGSKAAALLGKLKDFCNQIDDLVIDETNAWITEFQSNLTKLDSFLSEQKKSKTPNNQPGDKPAE